MTWGFPRAFDGMSCLVLGTSNTPGLAFLVISYFGSYDIEGLFGILF